MDKNEKISAIKEPVMVKVWFLRLKSQKDSLYWHRDKINDIYNTYYQTNELPSFEVIHGESVETETKRKTVYS